MNLRLCFKRHTEGHEIPRKSVIIFFFQNSHFRATLSKLSFQCTYNCLEITSIKIQDNNKVICGKCRVAAKCVHLYKMTVYIDMYSKVFFIINKWVFRTKIALKLN